MSSTLETRQARSLFLFSCLCYLPLVYTFWFVCDDAFISFRYAKHFAMGEGLRYNLGPHAPVEGYSNLLWVLICAFYERLNISSELFAPLLSTLCSLVLLYQLSDHLSTSLKLSLRISTFGVLLCALFPPLALWSSGGLATAPYALLVFLCYRALFDWTSLRYSILFGILLVLIRAEGAIVAIGLGGLSLLFSPLLSRRRTLLYLLTIIFSIALLTIWRHSYYGEFFPNTVLAKGEVTLLRLERGWKYVAVFALTFPSFLAALLFSFASLVRPKHQLFLPACCFLAFVIYAVLSGGDFMAMGRFLVPAFVFQAILLVASCRHFFESSQKITRNSTLSFLLFLLVSSVLPAWNIHIVPENIRSQLHFRENTKQFRSETEQWQAMKQRSVSWKEKGLTLKAVTQTGDSLVAKAIGNVGYFSELTIYDQFGLVSKEVAHLPESHTPRSPGHDKEAPIEFFLKYQPTYLDAKLLSGKRLKASAKRIAREWHAHRAITSEYAPILVPLSSFNSHKRMLLLLKRTPHGTEEAWGKLLAPSSSP